MKKGILESGVYILVSLNHYFTVRELQQKVCELLAQLEDLQNHASKNCGLVFYI